MKTDEVNYHSTCTYFHIFIKTLDIYKVTLKLSY